MVHRLDNGLVGEHVEFLLDLPLHILRIERAEDIDETCTPHFVGDQLGGEGDIVEDAGQLSGGLGKEAFLFDDEPVDGDDRCGGVLDQD
jgi:hypothetical protein